MVTRPWEGLCLALPVAAALGVWTFRARGAELRERLLAVVLPAALPLAATGAFLLLLNRAVTGDPLELPYALNRRMYHQAPVFLWQSERPAHDYSREAMRRFYVDWRESEETVRGGPPTRNPLVGLALWFRRYKLLWGALAGAILTAVFVRGPRVRFLLIPFACVLAGISLQSYRKMHYLAPAMGLCVVLLVSGFRTLGSFRVRGRRWGRVLPAIVLSAAAVGFVRNTVLTVLRRERGLGDRREELVARLNATPGKHVVLVRYGPKHSVHEEWVYNGADIDGGKVVFAFDLGPEENGRLLRYYRDRAIWRFAPDDGDALDPAVIPALPAEAPRGAD